MMDADRLDAVIGPSFQRNYRAIAEEENTCAKLPTAVRERLDESADSGWQTADSGKYLTDRA